MCYRFFVDKYFLIFMLVCRLFIVYFYRNLISDIAKLMRTYKNK